MRLARTHFAMLLGATILAMSLSGFADTPTVTNGSFESQILAPGAWTTNSVVGWTVNGEAGTVNAGVFNSGAVLTPTDGNNILFLNSGSVSQILGTISGNTAYSLSVDVGRRSDLGAISYLVQLFAGSTLIAQDSSLTPGAGQFLTSSLYFNSGLNPFATGQNLTIVLQDTGSQTWTDQVSFDNVRLSSLTTATNSVDVAGVPEPATLTLLAFGLLALRKRVARK